MIMSRRVMQAGGTSCGQLANNDRASQLMHPNCMQGLLATCCIAYIRLQWSCTGHGKMAAGCCLGIEPKSTCMK